MEKNELPHKKKPLENYIRYSGLAIQMIAGLCLAAWSGGWMDKYFRSENHLFTIFLMLFAVVGTIYSIIKSLTNNE